MNAPEETAKSQRAIDGAVRFAEAAAVALSDVIVQVFESPAKREARRRIACAQRTEQQIRTIVRDEIRLFVTGDGA